MLKTVILILLSLCTESVRPREEAVHHDYKDESTYCKGGKYSKKYNDVEGPSCMNKEDVREKEECSASRDNGVVGEASCDSVIGEENDQSDLVMLKQENQDTSTKDCDVPPEKCNQQPSETEKYEVPVVETPDVTNKEDHEELPSELVNVPRDSAHQSDLTQEEDEERSLDADSLPISENIHREPELDEFDLEQENIPLREILMKLKPLSLIDDEDEQSDYLAPESSIEDESEVEEEALVSSGSSEKQEQNLNTNGTKDTTEGNGASSSTGSKKAICLELNTTIAEIADVEVISATALLKLLQVDPNVTSRSSSGPCHLIYFFSPYCPFSVMGSPYVNALARSLPNIPIYGLDSIEYHSVNARYGVMGTPTLLLFHNGNGVGRYNSSEFSVTQLMSFIKHYTDQDLTAINVTSSDFRANLPSQLAEVCPYELWAAWLFLISFASWLFLTSDLCARLTEAILNNWREAEAQNDHQD